MSLADSSFFPWLRLELFECSGISCPVLDVDLEVLEFSLRLMLGVVSLAGSCSFSRGILASLFSLYTLNLWKSSGDNRV